MEAATECQTVAANRKEVREELYTDSSHEKNKQ